MNARPSHTSAPLTLTFTAIVSLACALAVSIVLAVGFGPAHIAPLDVVRTVASHIGDGVRINTMIDDIVWQIRLPRVLLGALVGAALALSGAVLQAATSNRLADPHLLGVSAGASVGAVAATLWLGAAWGALTLPACAFVGALAATALVIGCGTRGARLDAQRLLLAGVAMSFVLMALANLLLYMGDQRASASVLFWMLGGLGLARWSLLGIPAAFVAGGLLLLIARRRELNALMSGDIVAATLGLNVARVRRELFVVCSLLTAAMVAVSGAIGFVGLVAPHIARRLVGTDHARVLPASALVGALLLVWADVTARTLIAPDDLPVGVVTGLFGGAFFVLLIGRGK
ncbi:FecCD family ABC transporter permease [Paraburkholderia tropica]|uniref:Iron complex transport system permease protein n=1 Tax=Paraburkholderia tropica TaxID=92647 RepID=A0AAQ1JSR0_9BURK|nr:iron ABC transporter permease [Paraburkholderia tropica]RQN39649.1 iron ABC transporter permease [Paraburkholderia tropica]SEJ21250.1 iron complex transport system permease protein [Paraburkholderia tropica]